MVQTNGKQNKRKQTKYAQLASQNLIRPKY